MYDDEVNDNDAASAAGEAGVTDDGTLMGDLRDRLSQLPTAEPVPIESVVRRGRSRRRRQRGVLVGAGATAVLAVAVAVPVLGQSAGSSHLGAGSASVHVKLASFAVDSDGDGTVSLFVNPSQQLDAGKAQAILAQAGVPAVVRYGAYCTSAVPAEVVPAVQRIVRVDALRAAAWANLAAIRSFGIRSAAIPAHFKLSIGDFDGKVIFGLVSSGPLTCSSAGAAQACPSVGPVIGVPVTGTLAPSASTLPVATLVPAATVPASTLPASTLPASTLPASTLPASTHPDWATTTLIPGGAPPVPKTAIWCVVAYQPVTGSTVTAPATSTTLPSATTTLP